jgi:hypothetical protein
MAKKLNKYRNLYPISGWKYGGPLPQMWLGGDVAGSFLNKATTPKNTGIGTTGTSSGVGTASTIAGAVGGIANALTPQNTNPYQTFLPGQSTAQKTVDTVASIIPFYSAGKAIGNFAKSDYQSQNEFGELTNTNKFEVADTIGSFIDPLSSFISGLSGEGWTAKQRAEKINGDAAGNRRKYEADQWKKNQQMEIASGNAGRYYDENQMMQAAMGGPLPQIQVPYLEAFPYGGPLSSNNFGGQGMADYAEGGNLPVVTEYNAGGEHEMNPQGGVPVDAMGNKVVVSGGRPVALTEQGEVSWWNPSTKQSYVFSNKIIKD